MSKKRNTNNGKKILKDGFKGPKNCPKRSLKVLP